MSVGSAAFAVVAYLTLRSAHVWTNEVKPVDNAVDRVGFPVDNGDNPWPVQNSHRHARTVDAPARPTPSVAG